MTDDQGNKHMYWAIKHWHYKRTQNDVHSVYCIATIFELELNSFDENVTNTYSA